MKWGNGAAGGGAKGVEEGRGEHNCECVSAGKEEKGW